MSRGSTTKTAILSDALDLASIEGLEGLSIGELASRTGMSKSGLFAHFGSKEELQLATLKAGVERFIAIVIKPALQEPRGLARIAALFHNWLAWASGAGPRGGCVLLAASVEWDDKEGPVRDYLVGTQSEWLGFLAEAAHLAVGTGEFRRDLDVMQFAHELNAIYLNFHLATRLLRDPDARARAERAFARLLRDARHAPSSA
ncbi:MAG: TetR/AcrR family transcriptional regulator [Gemmatimonadales bacterium]|jgi:AcrR family transcriptional regulator